MIYRQGDVILKPIQEIPKNAQPKGTNILVEGEITGHAHQILDDNACVYVLGDQQFLEVINDKTELIHEEHATLEIPRGTYEVIRQREVDLLNEIRKVSD